jgi:hypothetical protein
MFIVPLMQYSVTSELDGLRYLYSPSIGSGPPRLKQKKKAAEYFGFSGFACVSSRAGLISDLSANGREFRV